LEVALDRVYADFMAKVGSGRNMPADRVRAVAKGQVWSGADAHGKGLVDELGGYMTALKLARQAAAIADDAAVNLVEFPQMDNSLAGLLQHLTDSGSTEDAVRLARLVEALEPIARVLGQLVDSPTANNLRMPALQRSQ
jgi:protease-4